MSAPWRQRGNCHIPQMLSARYNEAVATGRHRVCRCLVVIVLVLVKHHLVPGKQTQFLGWTISSGASPWLAYHSQMDVLHRIDGEQLLTDLPDSVLD